MLIARFIFFLFLLASPYLSAEFVAQDFDQEIHHALKEWQIPGCAIAIIKDGKVVHMKGYGVLKAGEEVPVNEKTLFAIGSCTKAFTATALCMLEEEKKLTLDDSVADWLEAFYLFNPYVTSQVSIRDFLTHRTGLGDHDGDLLWYRSPYTRSQVIARLRYLRPSAEFRTAFAYQNIFYLAAGEIIPIASDETWDSFIQKRLFAPLAMTESYTDLSFLQKTQNVAAPHYKLAEKITPFEWSSVDNIAPAVGIVSNTEDLVKWVHFQLGATNNLISKEKLDAMHTPQTLIEPTWLTKETYPKAHFLAYGLGWFLSDYEGRSVIEHGGIINGATARIALVPEEKLGVIVLTNLNGTMFPQAITNSVFDQFLACRPYGWKEKFLKLEQSFEQGEKDEDKLLEDARIQGTKPTLELKEYAGEFDNALYGPITVTFENGKLYMRIIGAHGPLEHWHYDTFRLDPQDPLLLKPLITFSINSEGKIETITVPEIISNEVFERGSK